MLKFYNPCYFYRNLKIKIFDTYVDTRRINHSLNISNKFWNRRRWLKCSNLFIFCSPIPSLRPLKKYFKRFKPKYVSWIVPYSDHPQDWPYHVHNLLLQYFIFNSEPKYTGVLTFALLWTFLLWNWICYGSMKFISLSSVI